MRLISAGSLVRAQSGPPLNSFGRRRRAIADEEPANKQTDCCACDVNRDVTAGCGSTRVEGLMIFIRRRKHCGHDSCDDRWTPEIDSHHWPVMSYDAPHQGRQDRVFCQMPALAHNQLNLHDGLPRNVWIEPEQERHKKPRGMFGRHQVR